MNLKNFLQNNSLKTKEININGIDEKNNHKTTFYVRTI